jgi:hypothetical protein
MTTQWQAYHLNKMVQESLRNPAQMGQLISTSEALFDKYQLTEAERVVFRKPTGAALRELGLHPILAMVNMIFHDEKQRDLLTISPEHLARMKELC